MSKRSPIRALLTHLLTLWLTAAILVVAGVAHAGDLSIGSYAPLKQVSLEASEVRQDMEAVLRSISSSQQRLDQAELAAEDIASEYGVGSEDHRLAQEHLKDIRRETMSRTLEDLEHSEQRLATAELSTRRHVQSMLQSRQGYAALVEGHLRDERNPVVTAVLLSLAIRNLHARCQLMMSEALVGQLESDLAEIESTLRLIGDLDTTSGRSPTSLEDAWRRLSINPTSPGAIDSVDALDRLLP